MAPIFDKKYGDIIEDGTEMKFPYDDSKVDQPEVKNLSENKIISKTTNNTPVISNHPEPNTEVELYKKIDKLPLINDKKII